MQSARQKFYTIGEAAKFLGVSSETLRRWDRQGKIRIGRTPAGYRVFNEQELELLKQSFQPQESFGIKPYTTLHSPQIKFPRISFPKVSFPKIGYKTLIVCFLILIFIISNAVTFYTLTTFTPLPNILSREVNAKYQALSGNITVVHEKSVLGIETALIPAAQEGGVLAQTYLTRIVSFFKSISIPSFRLPFLALFTDVSQTENDTQEDLELRIESLEESVRVLSLGEESIIADSLTLSSLTTTTLLATTINTNTFDGSKLIFSGSSPSIYPSTANTQISLNASGTGAINIGNAGTGDIYLGGGSGDSGCTLTNNNGSFNCSSNITSAGDLIANGGDILTDSTTLNINVANTGAVNFKDGTNTLMSITDTGTEGDLNITGVYKIDGTSGSTVSACGASQYLGGIAVTGGIITSLGSCTTASSSWSGLTDPTANLSLSMAANTTTLTYNAVTGTGNLFILKDTASNTGTGYLLSANTAASSNLKPFQIQARGNAIIDTTAAGILTLGNLTLAQNVQFFSSSNNLTSEGALTLAGGITATTLAGTLSTAAQPNVTSLGTLTSLSVTGNINSSAGALQTNGVTRIDNSGNLTAGTGAFSGTVTVGGGTGKIDVGTVDPPYTIGGTKFATYLSSMTGIKEETAGIIKLKNGKYDIEFNKVVKGSDLWLFYQVSDFGKNWENLTAQLTPDFDGRVWYTKDPKNRKLTIYGSFSGEVSYHFIAPRFDYLSWPNTRNGGSEGFILDEKD